MTTKLACTKCKGDGLVAREGAEADKDMHPVLANHKTVCDRCGGSGVEPSAEALRAAQTAAKAQQS